MDFNMAIKSLENFYNFWNDNIGQNKIVVHKLWS